MKKIIIIKIKLIIKLNIINFSKIFFLQIMKKKIKMKEWSINYNKIIIIIKF
jgi:hypothetical protein